MGVFMLMFGINVVVLFYILRVFEVMVKEK